MGTAPLEDPHHTLTTQNEGNTLHEQTRTPRPSTMRNKSRFLHRKPSKCRTALGCRAGAGRRPVGPVVLESVSVGVFFPRLAPQLVLEMHGFHAKNAQFWLEHTVFETSGPRRAVQEGKNKDADQNALFQCQQRLGWWCWAPPWPFFSQHQLISTPPKTPL